MTRVPAPAPGPAIPPAAAPRPTSFVVFVLLGVAGVLAIGGNVPLLGIPGALWLEVASPVAGLFTDARMAGDAAWPAAIIVTFLWPWFLPAAYLLAMAVLPRGRGRWVLTVAVTALGAVALATATQIVAGRLT